MNLDERFSEEECRQIVQWACGRPVKKGIIYLTKFDEEKVTELREWQKAEFDNEHGDREQELEIWFYAASGKDCGAPDFKVVIGDDGGVDYMNFTGCRFRLAQPMKIYKMIVEKFKGEDDE